MNVTIKNDHRLIADVEYCSVQIKRDDYNEIHASWKLRDRFIEDLSIDINETEISEVGNIAIKAFYLYQSGVADITWGELINDT